MKLTRTELNELIKEKVEQRVSAANEVDDIEEADELSAGLAGAGLALDRAGSSAERAYEAIAKILGPKSDAQKAEFIVNVFLPKIGLSGDDVVKMVNHFKAQAKDAEATPVGQPTPQEVDDIEEADELEERTKTTDTAYGRDDGGRRTKKPSGELNEEEEEVEEGYDAWDRDDEDKDGVSEDLTLKEWKNNELNKLLNSKFKIGN